MPAEGTLLLGRGERNASSKSQAPSTREAPNFTATAFFVRQEDVSPGTFIAAVGADDVHKQEIDPALMATGKVVADHLEQCCAIGDTHHAIAAGLMRMRNWLKSSPAANQAGRAPAR